MDRQIIKVLLEIKVKYGEDVFSDKKRLNNFLKDLLTGDIKYSKCRGRVNAIMAALDEHAYERLAEHKETPEKTQEYYINILKSGYSLNDEAALFAINALSAVIGAKILPASNQVENSPPQSVQTPESVTATPESETDVEISSFEDIVLLDGADMQRLLRIIDNDDIVRALIGADEKIQNAFFNNMSRRSAGIIKEDIDNVRSNTRDRDIQSARQKIIDEVHKLEEAGWSGKFPPQSGIVSSLASKRTAAPPKKQTQSTKPADTEATESGQTYFSETFSNVLFKLKMCLRNR